MKGAEQTNKIPIERLQSGIEIWLKAGRVGQHSSRTVDSRRDITNKLLWYLDKLGAVTCGPDQLSDFLDYLTSGSQQEGGRWGNGDVPGQKTRAARPARPSTVYTYYGHLRTLFTWLAKRGVIGVSPMEHVAVPIARSDQIIPFTTAQIEALIAAARRSRHPRRDEAIVRFLHDTGVRASELCGLLVEDVDLVGCRCQVLGKGNKTRPIFFGKSAARAVYNYLNERDPLPSESLFTSDRGLRTGEGLTRTGLRLLIVRLGKAAGIQQARCSPHTFRHTFAVEFLRAGGMQSGLMAHLGHTNIQMTLRYVRLAEADVENQCRRFSPGDRLGRARR